MKDFNPNTDLLTQSDIRAVTQLINQKGGINLGQGICDLPTPDPIKEAAIEAIRNDQSVYSHYAGVQSVKKACFEKFVNRNSIPLDSEEQVMVGAGSTGVFVAAMMTLLKPGDHVVLFEPYYGYHVNLMKIMGYQLSFTRMVGEQWEINWPEFESLIRPETKAVIVTTPANPCGKVWNSDELEHLQSVLEKHDLWVITDEVYEHMVYDDHMHMSLASLPGALERTITLNSFSKSYNMTGWRLGSACASPEVAERMGLISDLIYICAPTPLQHGLLAGLNMDESYYTEMLVDYAKKRELLCSTLEECGFIANWPQGAYYCFASFEPLSGLIDGFSDDKNACQTLVEKAGIGTIPGRAFFDNPDHGRYYLRFSFGKEFEVLQQACRQLKEFFSS